MYIWLKKGAKQQLERLKKDGWVGEIRVEIHRISGKEYLAVYADPFDPTADIPDIPSELIEKVSHKDRIYCGFRAEGVYLHKGATLLVKGESRMHSEMMMQGEIRQEQWQDISVSAPTIQALKEIYTLVRQGLLTAEQQWGSFSDVPTPTPVD